MFFDLHGGQDTGCHDEGFQYLAALMGVLSWLLRHEGLPKSTKSNPVFG